MGFNNLYCCIKLFLKSNFILNKEPEIHSLLSSVRVLSIPHLDTILTQYGPESTLKALTYVNQLPSLQHVAHSTDSINQLFLELKSKFTRQNIFCAEHFSWPHSALLSQSFSNVKGAMVSAHYYPNYFSRDGVFWNENNQFGNPFISIMARDLGKSTSESFGSRGINRKRLLKNSKNNNSNSQAKINAFLNDVWGQVRENQDFDSSLLIVGSIAEFRRLKQLFKEKGSPVGSISEHSSKRKVQSVLAKFNNGRFFFLNKFFIFQILHFLIKDEKILN